MRSLASFFFLAAFALPGSAARADEYDELIASAEKAINEGDFKLALTRLDRAEKLDPKFPVAYIKRAWVHVDQKNYDKAIEQANKALACKPLAALDEAASYYYRGLAYKGKKEYAKSIKDWEKGIQLNPNYTGSYDELAWLLATCSETKLRDGFKAYEYVKKARDLDPDASFLMDTAAAVYAECGDFPQAVNFQKMAIEALKKEKGKAETLKDWEARLELYKKEMPYREKK